MIEGMQIIFIKTGKNIIHFNIFYINESNRVFQNWGNEYFAILIKKYYVIKSNMQALTNEKQ